jgi:hypothetical protein
VEIESRARSKSDDQSSPPPKRNVLTSLKFGRFVSVMSAIGKGQSGQYLRNDAK